MLILLCSVGLNCLWPPSVACLHVSDIGLSSTSYKNIYDPDVQCLVMLLVRCFQGYQSLQSYRIANILWNQGRKVLALALQSRISEVKHDFLISR